MKIEHLNATFQPAKIGHPHGLQVTYLKDNSTRNIFVYHEDGKVGAWAGWGVGWGRARYPPRAGVGGWRGPEPREEVVAVPACTSRPGGPLPPTSVSGGRGRALSKPHVRALVGSARSAPSAFVASVCARGSTARAPGLVPRAAAVNPVLPLFVVSKYP